MADEATPPEPGPDAKLAEQYAHDDAEETFEPPVKPAAEPPKTPRKHPASMVRLAIRYGASRENIEQTSTGDLADWIEEQELSREAAREAATRDRGVETARRTEAAKPNPKPIEPSQEEDWGVDEAGNPISEKDIHPAIVRKLKAQENKLAELEVGLKGTTEREQARSILSANERLDDGFASLPPKILKIVGEGTLLECTPDEQEARLTLLTSAKIDTRNPPSPKVLAAKLAAAAAKLQKAFGGVVKGEDGGDGEDASNAYADLAEGNKNYPKKKAGLQPNGKPRITEEDFEAGTLPKSSGRNSKPEKGRKLAARAVGNKMRELQMTDKDFEEYEEDGMPE